MFNPATRGHRTVKIHTQAFDAKFAPGERVASLLTGPDNGHDYTGFAFVKPDGQVYVWRSRCLEEKNGGETRWQKLADMIANPGKYEAHGVVYQFATVCRKCNRVLTMPESVRDGIGPICRGKE